MKFMFDYIGLDCVLMEIIDYSDSAFGFVVYYCDNDLESFVR